MSKKSKKGVKRKNKKPVQNMEKQNVKHSLSVGMAGEDARDGYEKPIGPQKPRARAIGIQAVVPVDTNAPGQQTTSETGKKKKISPIILFGLPAAAVVIIAAILMFFVIKSINAGNGTANARINDDGISDSRSSNNGNTVNSGDNSDADNEEPSTSTLSQTNTQEKPTPPPGDPVDDSDKYYEDGVLMLQILRDADGKITGRIEFEYYDNGYLMEMAEYNANDNAVKRSYYLENGMLSYWWENKYDTRSNRVASARYNEDGIQVMSSEFAYNIAGVNTRRTDSWYDENGVILRFVVADLYSNGATKLASFFRTDTEGEVLYEIQEYDNDGVLTTRTHIEHGAGGEKTFEVLEYGIDGEQKMKTIIEYDADGGLNRRFVHEYDETGILLLFVHEYNESDVRVLITEIDYDSNGVPTGHRERDLSPSGSVLRTRHYRPGETTPYRTDTTQAPPPAPPATPEPPPTPESSPPPPPPPTPTGCQNPGHGEYDAGQQPRTTYDENGRRDREYYYYRDGCVWYYNQFTYDADGNLVNITRHGG